MNAQTKNSEVKCGAIPTNEVYTETVLVTPEIAKQWLKLNTANRPISEGNVASIAWDITHDKWTLTHQGIAFNTSLELIDGQHRLHAVIRANKAVPMRVSYNIDATYHAPIDTGRLRTAAYLLGSSPRRVALCNALALLTSGRAQRASAAMIAEVDDGHREAVDWALKAFPSQRSITASIIAAHVYAYPVAPDLIDAFAYQLTNYAAPNPDAPAAALRRHIERVDGLASTARLALSFVTLRCLQAHCQGESLSRVVATDMGLEYFAMRRASIGIRTC